ncbi:MAG: protein-export chaperone SecB [Kiloniellales bacterium]|nr:protein-export chaperone SecB [Kiloniellales bacterium]MDJ0969673.1 protein-export chaperone SecB [Kiloniellales bacterium]MDJ0980416.1 protein-export chaperone SecB [Kiloniellales bacterium]
MTGDDQGDATPDAEPATQPGGNIEETSFDIRIQYLKDISFENPNAPAIYAKLNQQPDISVTVDVNARSLEGRIYEIVLTANVDAKYDGTQGFLIELEYAALIQVSDEVSPEDLEPLLLVEAPRFLFPFARDLISSATRDGGFPPILLAPINFRKLYQHHKAQKGQEAAQPAAESAPQTAD